MIYKVTFTKTRTVHEKERAPIALQGAHEVTETRTMLYRDAEIAAVAYRAIRETLPADGSASVELTAFDLIGYAERAP